mgnify:CR=1 FL=1
MSRRAKHSGLILGRSMFYWCYNGHVPMVCLNALVMRLSHSKGW